MEDATLWNTVLGGSIGFVLAQLVNVAKIVRDWWVKPKLVIEQADNNNRILSHSAEVGRRELLREEVYGFYVRNTGRSIATGVRVQLVRMEYQERDEQTWNTVSNHAYDLREYTNAYAEAGETEAVLVPAAAIAIFLASSREDWGLVRPGVRSLPDYYEEQCLTARQYRFTVVAFDDQAHSTSRVLTIGSEA